MNTYKETDDSLETVPICDKCLKDTMRHLGGYFASSPCRHLICNCGAHYYTPNKEHTTPQWYTAEEWSKKYEE